MKRQLIAALLALNVAAVAVPSATFTVSAAEVEAQAEVTDEKATLEAEQAAALGRLQIKVNAYTLEAKKEAAKILKDNEESIYQAKSKDAVSIAEAAIEEKFKPLLSEADRTTIAADIRSFDSGRCTCSKHVGIINGLKSEATKALNDAVTKADGERAFSKMEGNAETQGIKLLTELVKEYKQKVKDNTPDTKDYDVTARGQISGAVTAVTTVLDSNPSTSEAITDAYKTFTDAIAKIATRDLNKYKEQKKTALDDFAAKLTGTYTKTQKGKIDGCVANGKNAIEAAKNVAEVDAAYDEAVKNINAVPTEADTTKAVGEVVAGINSIGTISRTDYNDKYATLKAIEDKYAALEEGPEGKGKIDADAKKKLDNARIAYDAYKAYELREALKKLDFGKVTYDNRGEFKAELDRIKVAKDTIKVKPTGHIYDADGTLIDTWVGDSIDNIYISAEGAYSTAIIGFQTQFVNELDKLVGNGTTASDNAATLKDILDGKKEVVDGNRLNVEKAIQLYEELCTLDRKYASDSYKYAVKNSKLVAALKVYTDKQEAAAAKFDLSKAKISVEATAEYTGSAIRPAVSVTNVDGAAVANTNYIVAYDDNVNVGTAKVTVIAVSGSDYKGSASTTFKITEKALTGAKVSVADMYYYNGTARNANVTVSVDGKNLAKGTDYTVVYKNNKNIGKATAEITGKGNYAKTVNATYVIKPAKSALKSLKAGKKKLTVKTAKQPGAKYQIAYKVKGGSYKTVKTSNVSKTIKSLKSGKTYAVKIRAYKSIDGKTYYGRYSAVKTVKVK